MTNVTALYHHSTVYKRIHILLLLKGDFLLRFESVWFIYRPSGENKSNFYLGNGLLLITNTALSERMMANFEDTHIYHTRSQCVNHINRISQPLKIVLYQIFYYRLKSIILCDIWNILYFICLSQYQVRYFSEVICVTFQKTFYAFSLLKSISKSTCSIESFLIPVSIIELFKTIEVRTHRV